MSLGRVLVAVSALALAASCAKNVVMPPRVALTKPTQKQAAVAKPVKPAPIKIAIAPTPTVTGKATSVSVEEIVKAAPKVRPIQLAKLIKPTTSIASDPSCNSDMVAEIPNRRAKAGSGSAVVQQAFKLSGTQRDTFVAKQLLDGNTPAFLWNLTPVAFTGVDSKGTPVQITICVTPDYLAVGDNNDFVRMPMGLPAAAEVANGLGFILPTTKMVDGIYQQAGLQLAPSPMTPGSQMSSTDYLWKHNSTVQTQRQASRQQSGVLVAGQKKDLVLSNVLRSAPGRVAIYGWHRTNGKPIQPLSTVHGESYADYSHGVRLVSKTAFVNGSPRAIASILEDPKLASILSKEGPISKPLRLMAAISTN